MLVKRRLALIKPIKVKPGNEGFTLVELVVVIAVMAVLGAVALPSFLCVIPKARAPAALAAMKHTANNSFNYSSNKNRDMVNN